MTIKFLDLAKERVVFLDGAMGTEIQNRDPSVDDFGGAQYEGCNEWLVVTKPKIIQDIHETYFKSGADAVETNTFGAAPIVLAEYGLEAKAYEINLKAAQIAKEVASSFSRPAYVIGSVGPGTKLVTLGHVSYDVMLESFRVQMRGLIDGGVDLILMETAQDIQQLKIAIRAASEVMKEKNVIVPLMAQVTVELTGTLLVGTDIQAALSVLEMFPISVLGLNCATGPDEMMPHFQYLSKSAPFMLSCLPNAGLPENVKGQTVYPLGPKLFADKVAALVENYGIQIVGGCCGTTPEHIRQLVERLQNHPVPKRQYDYENSVASLYNAVPVSLDPKPLYVGERTNANGSKLFRDMLAKDDFDGLVSIAKGQLKEGAHVLDCCTAFVSRDEVRDMTQFISRLATQVNIPIMVDSTEVGVIEASLKNIPGKAIVNSINFEDGEERARKVLELCKTYGASVVALTIDEEGMAKSCERKLSIAKRIYRLAHDEYGLKASDIIFDPLTFTLGSGDEEFRKSAEETLNAIEAIKKDMPGVLTILGLSNVSFGLDAHTRRFLNSVMLYHAIQKGLDMAICNAAKITPLFKIEPEVRQMMEDLLYDRRSEGYDPLKSILAYFSGRKLDPNAQTKKDDDSLPTDQRLSQGIIDGDKIGIVPILDKAMKEGHKPLDIINNFLLNGMRVVGEKFGAGEMQLPFVLESAEAMKAAVAHLEPHMEKSERSSSKGKILLATVKGDVHDIGKNLVDIILSNNGFSVVNMGIKQPIEAILEKFLEHRPDAIGLSGLLVKSTAIMKSDLEIMRHKDMHVPVILGGAALTRKFVSDECQASYGGKVYYAEDAFEGLRIMSELMGHTSAAAKKDSSDSDQSTLSTSGSSKEESKRPRILSVKRTGGDTPLTEFGQSSWVKRYSQIPVAPFWGTKILTQRPGELFKFLDEFALVRTRWQFIKGEMDEEAFTKILEDKARPILNTWKKRSEEEGLLEPKAVYGYFSCAAEGNDLHIYPNHESQELLTTFTFPRQASGKRLSLSDYFNPAGLKQRDIIAMQVVTMGEKASEFSQQLYARGQYSDYFYFHGLSTELAESFAEYLHAKIRKEMGIHHWDAKNMRKLFAQGYQGSRYSFGYPACPDLEDNFKLFKCLTPDRIGVTLTENAQMVPEQSTCAVVAWHPQARYFAV